MVYGRNSSHVYKLGRITISTHQIDFTIVFGKTESTEFFTVIKTYFLLTQNDVTRWFSAFANVLAICPTLLNFFVSITNLTRNSNWNIFEPFTN